VQKPKKSKLPNSGKVMDDCEDLFKNVFSSLIHGILIVDTKLNIRKSNPALEEMFCRSGEDLIGKPLSLLFPDQPALEDKFKQVISDSASYQLLEVRACRKSVLSHFPAGMTLSPLFGDKGESLGALATIKDLSLLKDLESVSRPFERLSTTEALTLGMAHEIRNPLGGIRASAQLLLSDLESSPNASLIQIIISEVDRITRLVKKMMDFSQEAEPKVKLINIHRSLEEIFLLEKETLIAHQITLLQEYDPSLPLIKADPDQIKQVFLNLIKNAREAMPNGGQIRVSTRYHGSYAFSAVSQSKPLLFIVVEVADNGCGMDDKQIETLFTPFVTTKSKGVGLGLALTLKIIENHKGTIKVSTQKNEGTAFQVFLPLPQK
jgi:two-component system, NtrC family, nitrogen regulation sensor histidine kinase GlnL